MAACHPLVIPVKPHQPWPNFYKDAIKPTSPQECSQNEVNIIDTTIHTYTPTLTPTCTHNTLIHTHIAHTYAHPIHSHIHTWTHMQITTPTCTQIHTSTRAHIESYTHIQTYTYGLRSIHICSI